MRKDNYCRIYVARHGETIWNVEHRVQGQKDSPLTKKGLRQASELAQGLKDVQFDAIFSSDLLRAKRTAKMVALDRKLAVQTTKLLREHNYGRYEGKLTTELREELQSAFAEYDELQDEEKFRFSIVPGGESDEVMSSRFITFLREVCVAYLGKTILVVSHGGIMAAFLMRIGFAKQDKVRITNTGYFVLKSDGVDFFIEETSGITLPT